MLKQDEIIEMAEQAGFTPVETSWHFSTIEAFAKLVAAKEREACAKTCETTVWSKDVKWWMDATKTQVSAEAGQQCANAIRARGAA